uniref:Uncharacterized protein n=1 Tax=Arundo donax TaxID=35708 RepID=A0A0A9C5E2_ARUDO
MEIPSCAFNFPPFLLQQG